MKALKSSGISFPGLSPVAVLLLVALSFPLNVNAQRQDFRTWWSADISKEIINNLEANVELEQRWRNNSLRYDRSLITASLQYEIINDLDIEGGYRYIVLNDDLRAIATSYRFHGDLSYGYGLSRFDFKVRSRLQYGFDDLNSLEDYRLNKLTNRNKFSLEYDVFGKPFSFFASYEFFLRLDNAVPARLSDHRFETGIEYDLSFKSSLEFSYMFDQEVNQSNPLQSHILVFSYGYTL